MVFKLYHSATAKIAWLSLILCVVLSSGLTSCKKKATDSPSFPIEGSWRALDSSATKYVIFSKGTVTYLLSGNYNIHDMAKGAYAADEETVNFSLSGSAQLYNYKVSNDTLYLTNSSSYSRLIRDNTVNPDTWVKYSTTLQTNVLPSGIWIGTMDWLGTDFIISSTVAKKLYRANPTTSSITDSISTLFKITGLAVTGIGETWVNNVSGGDTKLYKIDPSTGATLFTSSPAPATPILMAADGNLIWFFSAAGLYTYNTTTDVFTLKKNMGLFLSTPGSLNPDMVIKDGYAYIAAANYVMKFNLATYTVEETYKNAQQAYTLGIAHDGNNFWLLNLIEGSSLSSIGVKLTKVQF